MSISTRGPKAADAVLRRPPPIDNEAVGEVFHGFPPTIRANLLLLRRLIFDTAARTEGVRELEETLKWGMPSYLTTQSKSGSTVRIHWSPSMGRRYGLYVHCQTHLIANFKRSYPTELHFALNPLSVDKVNRAVMYQP